MLKKNYNFVLDSLDFSTLLKSLQSAFAARSSKSVQRDLLHTWFVEACDQKYALAYCSARMGLHCLLAQLGEGHQQANVVIPGFSCVVVSNSVRSAGLEVRYADIDTATLTPGIEDFAKLVDDNTVAIVVQHVFGLVDEHIEQLKQRFPEVKIIEDCAHALGGCFADGQMLGSKGDYAFFSFEQSKPINVWTGGVLVGSDDRVFAALQAQERQLAVASDVHDIGCLLIICLHFCCFAKFAGGFGVLMLRVLAKLFRFKPSMSVQERHGVFNPSVAVRFSERRSAFINEQLKCLDKNKKHRQQLVACYQKHLGVSFKLPFYAMVLRYPLLVNDKKNFIESCARQGLQVGEWFSTVVHPADPAIPEFCYQAGSCPKAEAVCAALINLPLGLRITLGDVEKICGIVLSAKDLNYGASKFLG